MKFIVIPNEAFLSTQASLYELVERPAQGNTPANRRSPLAPHYVKIATGNTGDMDHICERLNEAYQTKQEIARAKNQAAADALLPQAAEPTTPTPKPRTT